MALELQDGEARFRLTEDLVEASTHWCQARIELGLAPDDLPRLVAGLEKLVENGHGSFLWTNDGGEVQIDVVMAKRGETHWSVRLQAAPDFLHELRLVFVGRQDDLPHLTQTLK